MSRRPATCFSVPIVLCFVGLALCGCGGSGSKAPPVAASQPTATPETAPRPSPTPVTVAETARAAPTPAPTPEPTPNTSLPGAIPPQPAIDPNAKPAVKPVDPLQWMQDREARKADYQRRLAEAQAKLDEATTNVAFWERTVLEFHNPLLPRPKLSPEDAAAITDMDGVARVKWGEGKLADARAAQGDAQKTVDDLTANPPPE